MKRSPDDGDDAPHDDEILKFHTQKRVELGTNQAVLTVFGMHDLVIGVFAPLFDLLTLYRLSLVNRRLRELLSRTDTLQKAVRYKGDSRDYPETLLAHPDVRITQYMTLRLASSEMRSFFPFRLPLWERQYVVYPSQPPFSMPDLLLERLVLPLLARSTLSSAEVTAHFAAIYGGIIKQWSLERFTVTPPRAKLLSEIRTPLCARVTDPDVAVPFAQFIADCLGYTGTASRFFWMREVLTSQIGANARVRDAIFNQKLDQNAIPGPTLLTMAVSSDNPSFLDAECVRLKMCLTPGENMAFCALTGSMITLAHVLNTSGRSCTHVKDAVRLLKRLRTPEADLVELAVFVEDVKKGRVNLQTAKAEFAERTKRCMEIFMDSYSIFDGKDPKDPEERKRVAEIMSSL